MSWTSRLLRLVVGRYAGLWVGSVTCHEKDKATLLHMAYESTQNLTSVPGRDVFLLSPAGTWLIGKTLSLLAECEIRFSIKFLSIFSFSYLLIQNPNRYSFFGKLIDRDSNYISIFDEFYFNIDRNMSVQNRSFTSLQFLERALRIPI